MKLKNYDGVEKQILNFFGEVMPKELLKKRLKSDDIFLGTLLKLRDISEDKVANFIKLHIQSCVLGMISLKLILEDKMKEKKKIPQR